MNRLPRETRGPIPVGAAQRSPDRAADHSNGHAPFAADSGKPATTRALKLLRFPAVRERTGLSRSTIWRLERIGAFPKHRRISANAVAWLEEDIMTWIESKMRDVAV
jgi:prophage regulatory protein